MKSVDDYYNEYYTDQPQKTSTNELDAAPYYRKGLLKNVGSLTGRAAISLGESFESALEAWGMNDSTEKTVAKLREFNAFKPDLDEALGQGWLKDTPLGSIPAAFEAMGPSLGAAAIGFGVGSAVGGGINPVTGIIGAIVSSLGVMGSADYQQTYEQEIKKGTAEDLAHSIALKHGTIEGVGEALSDLIGFGPMAKIFKKPLIETAAMILKTPAKKLATTVGKTYLKEQTTEIGQSMGQTFVSNKSNAEGEKLSMLEESLKTVIPTIFMTVGFGAATTKYEISQKRNLLKALQSGDKDLQQRASGIIFKNLKEQDPKVAKAWDTYSKITIARGSQFNIDENFVDMAANYDRMKANAPEIPVTQEDIKNHNAVKGFAGTMVAGPVYVTPEESLRIAQEESARLYVRNKNTKTPIDNKGSKVNLKEAINTLTNLKIDAIDKLHSLSVEADIVPNSEEGIRLNNLITSIADETLSDENIQEQLRGIHAKLIEGQYIIGTVKKRQSDELNTEIALSTDITPENVQAIENQLRMKKDTIAPTTPISIADEFESNVGLTSETAGILPLTPKPSYKGARRPLERETIPTTLVAPESFLGAEGSFLEAPVSTTDTRTTLAPTVKAISTVKGTPKGVSHLIVETPAIKTPAPAKPTASKRMPSLTNKQKKIGAKIIREVNLSIDNDVASGKISPRSAQDIRRERINTRLALAQIPGYGTPKTPVAPTVEVGKAEEEAFIKEEFGALPTPKVKHTPAQAKELIRLNKKLLTPKGLTPAEQLRHKRLLSPLTEVTSTAPVKVKKTHMQILEEKGVENFTEKDYKEYAKLKFGKAEVEADELANKKAKDAERQEKERKEEQAEKNELLKKAELQAAIGNLPTGVTIDELGEEANLDSDEIFDNEEPVDPAFMNAAQAAEHMQFLSTKAKEVSNKSKPIKGSSIRWVGDKETQREEGRYNFIYGDTKNSTTKFTIFFVRQDKKKSLYSLAIFKDGVFVNRDEREVSLETAKRMADAFLKEVEGSDWNQAKGTSVAKGNLSITWGDYEIHQISKTTLAVSYKGTDYNKTFTRVAQAKAYIEKLEAEKGNKSPQIGRQEGKKQNPSKDWTPREIDTDTIKQLAGIKRVLETEKLDYIGSRVILDKWLSSNHAKFLSPISIQKIIDAFDTKWLAPIKNQRKPAPKPRPVEEIPHTEVKLDSKTKEFNLLVNGIVEAHFKDQLEAADAARLIEAGNIPGGGDIKQSVSDYYAREVKKSKSSNTPSIIIEDVKAPTIGTEVNASDLVTTLTKSKNPIVKMMAQIIKKYAKGLSDINVRYNTKVIQSYYDSASNTIILTNNTTEKQVHELVHAITYNQVMANPKLKAKMKNLMDKFSEEVKRLENEGGYINVVEMVGGVETTNRTVITPGVEYALSNLDEFMAQSISDKDVQAILKGMKLKYTGKSFIKNFWDGFKDVVREALGISTIKWNGLTQMMDLIAEASTKEVTPTQRLAGKLYTQAVNERKSSAQAVDKIAEEPSSGETLKILMAGHPSFTTKEGALKLGKRLLNDSKKVIESGFMVASERLRRLSNNKYFKLMRWHNTQIQLNMKEHINLVTPFLNKVRGLSVEDQVLLQYNISNPSKFHYAEAIMKKNGMMKEWLRVKEVLDSLEKRAINVGIISNTLENYFPRTVKDYPGLMKWFKKRAEVDTLMELELKTAEKAIKRGNQALSPEEKQKIIVDYLSKGHFSRIPNPRASKLRTVEVLHPEMMQFYDSISDAIMNHLFDMNDKIQSWETVGATNLSKRINLMKDIRRLENKVKTNPENKELETQLMEQISLLEDSKLVVEDGLAQMLQQDLKIDDIEREEIGKVFKARFNQRGTKGAVQTLNNIGLLMTLGSPLSAITQLGDQAFNIYKHGGANAIGGMMKAWSTGEKISDYFDFNTPLKEYSHKASTVWLDRALSITQLKRLDIFGKESFLQASNSKYQKMTLEEFKRDWGSDTNFTDSIENVWKAFNEKRLTRDGLYILYSDLADYQPTDLSETSTGFQEAGDARIFWMLKSFAIKAVNNIVRETSDLWRSDKFSDKAKAVKNFFYLTMLLSLASAGADELKDIVLGRDKAMSDHVVDNFYQLFLMSRYNVEKGVQRGNLIQSIAGGMIPPVRYIDDAIEDTFNFLTGEDVAFKTIRNAPIGGRIIYDRLMTGGKRDEYTRRRKSIMTKIANGERPFREIKKFNSKAKSLGLDLITSSTFSRIKSRLRKEGKK